jgi:hypothetical protein
MTRLVCQQPESIGIPLLGTCRSDAGEMRETGGRDAEEMRRRCGGDAMNALSGCNCIAFININ